MDQLIGNLRGQRVTFNDQTTQHFYAPSDGPAPDYSESGSADEEELQDRRSNYNILYNPAMEAEVSDKLAQIKDNNVVH
jgi:hypothetical protein